MGAFLNKNDGLTEISGNQKPKEHYAIVCPFHMNIMMVAHQVTEKNGLTKTGLHCPKCFCSKGVPISIPKPKKND